MVTIKINHKTRHIVFIVSALFASLSTTLILLYEDLLDAVLDKHISEHYNLLRIGTEAISHILVIFSITLLATYIFYNIFRWTPNANWKNIIKL